MDTSFELASSMSPKVNHEKNVYYVRKAPTVLALKKYFRRSSIIPNNNPQKNESIITIRSSSTSSYSEGDTNKSAIVISDSEVSLNMKNSTTNNTPIKNTDKKGLKSDENEHIPPRIPPRTSQRLSKEKYTNIKLWVDEVNKNSKQNNSAFSEVSTILDDDNQYFISPSTNIAANSTFLKPASKRFDELFKKKKTKQIISSHVESAKIKQSQNTDNASDDADVINDSLLTEDNSLTENCKNLVLEDSLELNLNDSLHSRIQKKQSEESNKVAEENFILNKSGSSDASWLQKKECNKNLVLDDSLGLNLNGNLHSQYQKQPSEDVQETPENKSVHSSDEYEVLLDSLYGNSWREKKEDILPSSEPRQKKKDYKTKKKVPNTEKPIRNLNINPSLETGSNNLLKTLQKERFKRALESPWARSLKNVCDSDTDSDDSRSKLPPTKLNFQDDFNNINNGLNSSSSSGSSNKKVQTKPFTKHKTKCRKNKVPAIQLDLNESGTYSFLASLSGSVPLSKCDISALIFRNNFKPNKEELAKRLFELYNEKIFDNAIPKDTPLEWNDRMRGTAGYCYCRKITRRTGAIERGARIVLSTKVLDSPDRVRDTLVHEMCHAVTWIVNQVADGHGALWQSWAQRAMKTFPELPPIKRCHQYAINTKYTYRCMECGYSIGRHTKSLDVDRKRCGYCYGQFEILINKTTKKGETKTVPVTPRKAGGFALFVKENYATYKTTDLKHGEVMKLLSQKFADLKVDKS